jgi:cell division protein ZapD
MTGNFKPADSRGVDSRAITYEQPLNERIRSFLRLEHLFALVSNHIEGTSSWASRATISALVEVNDLLSRSDVKQELIKELERQHALLVGLARNPAVDPKRLSSTMDELARLVGNLKSPLCQPGQTMRQDELIAAVKQRLAIPGGTCNFDLPGFHHWLSLPETERIAQLYRWYEDLKVVSEGIGLALGLIRSSATPVPVTAQGGFFQQSVDSGAACQLVRVKLPADMGLFPEISGGKHRCSVRCLTQASTQTRPVASDRDVSFELQCCVL